MAQPRLRPAARGIILDENDRILLCRFEFERRGSQVVVWSTPGRGVEAGESLLAVGPPAIPAEFGL